MEAVFPVLPQCLAIGSLAMKEKQFWKVQLYQFVCLSKDFAHTVRIRFEEKANQNLYYARQIRFPQEDFLLQPQFPQSTVHFRRLHLKYS